MIILEKGERADQLWGMNTEIITDEMIEALEQGKRLYLSVNDEYAVVIKKNGKRKTDKPEQTDSDTISRRQAIDALFEILDRPKHADFLYADEIARALNQLPPSPSRSHDISKAKFSCPICGAEMEVTVDEWDEGGAV